jgi:hypothetical protein
MLIELVENLKQQYEYVILDAPPVGEVSGTLSLNQVASSVLFVIGYDNASLPEIQSSLEKLDKSGTRVLGCVVNRVVSGKMLGITQTADDRKKIISKKAAEKKKSEESYGFDDKVNPNESPEELQKPKGGRKERKKKEKKGLFGRKKEEPAEAPKAEPNDAPKTESSETLEQKPVVKRNVYEDSIAGQTGAKNARTDQETMNELLRMSLTNDWGNEQDKKPDGPDGEKPAEQK